MLNLIRKVKEYVKKALCNTRGNEIVAIALILLFIILAAAPYIRNLGQTTSTGISNLNSQMQQVLNGQ
ncbi:flagellin [Thermoanaerobacter mathranii]|uniref:flagellin n=1 Tax=Thermoanaerobacter mathranii TaxID=583357 RepID=UPI000A05BA2C|nr:flagellin [Thermoanaerobacter mathranii]